MVDEFIITIDGPCGAGKSTTAKLLAERLGFIYLDTGAMYRAVSLKLDQLGIDLLDDKMIKEILENTDITFEQTEKGNRIFLDGKDVSDDIRTSRIDMLASLISQKKIVRDALVKTQRKFGHGKRIVVEGRDAGTIIFPNAQLKFFLTASLLERTKRRYRERKEKGEDVSFSDILEEIKRRDEMDTKRDLAPLKPADGAINVDSTTLTINDVISFMESIYKKKRQQ
ncbi:MAG: (d)CMP kinase [Deltaproteobacteria bacterium]|nr:(d)CMP kinase [Deltaproteobacteria bacterium]RLA89840.1 MAG: (d)CMP kinase [Deltaproteobacteria bacterium]